MHSLNQTKKEFTQVREYAEYAEKQSVRAGTDHSAQPASSELPPKISRLSNKKTVPEETAVGGVPHIKVCGFFESVTTYFSADYPIQTDDRLLQQV